MLYLSNDLTGDTGHSVNSHEAVDEVVHLRLVYRQLMLPDTV